MNNGKIEIIEVQLRQLYAQVVWTHKIQEKQADIYRKRRNVCELTRLTASTLISSGIIASIFVDSTALKIITASIAFIAMFLNSYMKAYDLSALSYEHKKSALELLGIRNRLTSTLTDIKIDELNLESIKEIRDSYITELEEVYKNCIDAGDKAVEYASKALKNTQDNTFTNAEINSYLPLYAHKGELDESK